MNTRQIQYVMKVAEERSFSEAAKKLYVAQPSLSEFIRKVEDELGYKIFDRTVTPLKLTEAGEVYLETAREIMKLEQSMADRLRDMSDNQYGKLSVGISPYSSFLPPALQTFLEIYPNYKIDIQDSAGTQERLKLLEEGKLDICVQPVFEPLPAKFAIEEIMPDELMLIVPENYAINSELFAHSDKQMPTPAIDLQILSMIRDIPFVTVDANKRLRKNINILSSTAGFEPNIKAVCHKSEGCVDLASYGIGATIVQLSIIKEKPLPHDVCCYRIRQKLIENYFAAIYIKNRYLSKAARTFIEIMKEL